MNQSSRIPTLLFLHARGELAEAEEIELAGWRKASAENEQLFREVSDPEQVRKMMAAFYRHRDGGFDKLKLRFPDLADAKLSSQVGYDPGADLYIDEVEERLDFPEKHIQESGLSKTDFWASLLEAIQLEKAPVDSPFSGTEGVEMEKKEEAYDEREAEDPDDNSRVEEPAEPYQTTLPRSKRKRRMVRIFISTAAAAAVVLGILLLTADSGSDRFRALMISPGGSKTAMDDFHRGMLAGEANISFEKTPEGETIYVFPNRPRAAKDDNFTLETTSGNEFILKLPDGAQVWVGTQSAISFPANFSQDTINLKVLGEIYFESSSHSGKQYVISTVSPPSPAKPGFGGQSREPRIPRGKPSTPHSAGQAVNFYVSSAHFNLSAYPEDSLIRVDLATGAVRVQWDGQPDILPLQLREGHRVVILNGGVSDSHSVNDAEIKALKNGQFYFDDSDIRTILSAVSRWYDVRIHDEGVVPDKKYSLHVPIGTDLSVVVEDLKKQGAPVLIQGKTITVVK